MRLLNPWFWSEMITFQYKKNTQKKTHNWWKLFCKNSSPKSWLKSGDYLQINEIITILFCIISENRFLVSQNIAIGRQRAFSCLSCCKVVLLIKCEALFPIFLEASEDCLKIRLNNCNLNMCLSMCETNACKIQT